MKECSPAVSTRDRRTEIFAPVPDNQLSLLRSRQVFLSVSRRLVVLCVREEAGIVGISQWNEGRLGCRCIEIGGYIRIILKWN